MITSLNCPDISLCYITELKNKRTTDKTDRQLKQRIKRAVKCPTPLKKKKKRQHILVACYDVCVAPFQQPFMMC